ncbi:MAG: hypothetical protein IPJ46_21325 [Anaerolineales bacterium]|nr:hypothetical protein [Anaerolineales bacterium]
MQQGLPGVREIIDGCLVHQRADGLFHDVVDQPETFIETNLSQMLAYSIYRGIVGGYLPLTYKAHADKMREAVHQKVDDFGYVQRRLWSAYLRSRRHSPRRASLLSAHGSRLERNPMTTHITSPSWLDAALEFCITKTRDNLATLTSFPERTEDGKWIQTKPDQHGWWVGGHWVGLLWLAYAATGEQADSQSGTHQA